ncbi:oxoglutarate/malate translocator protein, putative [Theileria equi strain WA]|uniref:Oxoglutarate/malate translocator protein, putative n=1 Tax=Theileria equi strain WA TaxID=1537102 RepID=L0AWD3_THEEQ|nr:oxoglutarate/malate translocator protein, putative [Theileria equi strain WA]AFZ79341.1 oxoglutarate/malate translocator protein, putative [Theileria equi strain WA]|eukprot:XP_004829007.1 oxoglutarate/malate translocator protein, putative [Theileria equi strain WA]
MVEYNLSFVPPSMRSYVSPCVPFALSGISGCMATVCIQPIDMVKVRIQVHASHSQVAMSPIRVFSHILRNEGILSLYKGLDAACARQLLYTTTRLGLFRSASDHIKHKNNIKTIPFYQKCGLSMVCGAIGALVGNPADLALVRMQSDSMLPREDRKNYTSLPNTICRICKEEGVFRLWKGAFPTVVRAVSLNLGMLSSFDQSKEVLSKYMEEGVMHTCISSSIAAFFAVTFSLPFDFVKTCLQKQSKQGQAYRGIMDCITKNYAEGGIARFYASYTTYYMRVAPHVMLTLIMMDYLTRLLRKHD